MVTMDAQEVVDCIEGTIVLQSTWAFKLKCVPNGLIKNFKAQFCARVDQHMEGINFFENYALLVQWITISVMHIGVEM